MKTLQLLLDFITAYKEADSTEQHICKNVIDATFVPKHVVTAMAKIDAITQPLLLTPKKKMWRPVGRRKPTNNKKVGKYEHNCIVCGIKFTGFENSKYCASKECWRILNRANAARYWDKKNLNHIQPYANYIQDQKDRILQAKAKKQWGR